MYTDSHCHITCDELYSRIDEVIKNMEAVSHAMIMCTNETEFQRALSIREQYPKCKVAWGWFPGDAKAVTDHHFQILQQAIDTHQLDCLGEIGLDYYWDTSFNAIQKEVFIHQIQMANKAGLPISIHMRASTKDTLEILKKYADTKIIFHCFSGSEETMKECLKMNALISFAGPVTFKNAKKAKACAAVCPLDRILTETDSPYMAPAPFRGKQNEPMYVKYIAEQIAALKQLDLDVVTSQVAENFQSLFT